MGSNPGFSRMALTFARAPAFAHSKPQKVGKKVARVSGCVVPQQ
jgi:hypothetical protein